MTELDPHHHPRSRVSFRSDRVAAPPLVPVAALLASVALVVVVAAWPGQDRQPIDRDPEVSSASLVQPPVPVAGAVVQVVSGAVGPGLAGQRLYIVAGPVETGTPAVPSLLVQHWGDLARGLDMDTTFAWVPASVVAAGTEPVAVSCPASVDSVLDIASLQPFERLVCFAGRTLTFGPTITSRLALGIRTSDRWLTEDAHSDVHTAIPFYDVPGISTTVPDHVWLRVSGHFDDPTSAECGGLAEVAWCRERFVVTEATPVRSPFLADSAGSG